MIGSSVATIEHRDNTSCAVPLLIPLFFSPHKATLTGSPADNNYQTNN
jgi:hypothetical protein